jgi:hypothetical protein
MLADCRLHDLPSSCCGSSLFFFYQRLVAVVLGVLTCTISENATWLSVLPTDGISVGDADTIEVIYEVAGLAIGDYATSIVVTDPNATNSSVAVAVVLHVTPTIAMRTDSDNDGDVDQEDFGRFQACRSGSGQQYSPGCEDADLNLDGDVDQDDWAAFESCMSGWGLSYRSDCG